MLLDFLCEFVDGHFELTERLVSALWGKARALFGSWFGGALFVSCLGRCFHEIFLFKKMKDEKASKQKSR